MATNIRVCEYNDRRKPPTIKERRTVV